MTYLVCCNVHQLSDSTSLCRGMHAQDDAAAQEGDSGSARKRRRLRYNNARDAAEKAKRSAATQCATAGDSQLSPGFASDLLQVHNAHGQMRQAPALSACMHCAPLPPWNMPRQALEALVPGQQGAWSDGECLTAIQTVLNSCSIAASAAWLPHLGRLVGRWAVWAGSQGTAAAIPNAAFMTVGGCFL
jgi:hypothetical protein